MKRGGCVCEELGSRQLTRRSKVAAQLSLCLLKYNIFCWVTSKEKDEVLTVLGTAWEREKIHCGGELKNFCWGMLLETKRISAFLAFAIISFCWFLLFGFFSSCLHFLFPSTCLQLYVISHRSAAVERETLGAFNIAFPDTSDGTPTICW